MAELTNEQLIDHIKNMTVLDLNNLVKQIEEEFGVSAAAAAVAVGGPVAAAGGDAAEEEKTEFDVILTTFGDKKIQVIKAVREITSLGLKEAKELVEKVPTPIKEAVSKEEADTIKEKLEAAGGQVDIK